MAQRLHPDARDAAVSRIAVITTGVVALGVAGTVGLGMVIAATAPSPKTANKTDYGSQSRNSPKVAGNAADQPESSSGDEDTTSGGS
jgi:hypothetical protein